MLIHAAVGFFFIMAWITLTTDDIRNRLAECELEAIEETGGGTGDRLAGILDQVTSLVRAKVGACNRNELGAAGTIPAECLHSAATIARHNLRATLPTTGSEDEGEMRRSEYQDAMNFLNDVAECKIGIVLESTAEIGGRSNGCYGGDDKHVF